MRLKLSLVLLAAFVLVPLAYGSSISYDTGQFQTGTVTGAFANRSTLDITITGSLNTITLNTGALTAFTAGCPAGSTCFLFSSGVTTVSHNGTSVFSDSLTGGITIAANGSASISASLADVHGITSGDVSADFTFTGTHITGGSGDLVATRGVTGTVPEPNSLLLFGSGVLGLVAKYRNKLSLRRL